MKDELRSKILLFTVFCSLFSITACGFKPVYAQDGESRMQLNQVFVSEIPKREGQVLRNKLQDLLGLENAPNSRYRVDIILTKERRNFGIQADLRVSRYDVVMTANYELIDNETTEILLRDSAKMYSSFNRTESEFSTFVAEEDATEQAAEQLAYRINLKLVSFFE